MDDIQNMTSFEDIGEWLTSQPEMLWQNAILDRPMPQGFSLTNFTMGDPQYREDLPGDGRGGFMGVIKFTLSHKLTLKESARMFRQTNIIINESISWSIESEKGFEHAVANGMHTHTMRYIMLADDWLNLSVFKRLSV